MNRSPSGFSFSTLIPGFLNFKAAEGLSPGTLVNYQAGLTQWLEWAGDPTLDSVSAREIVAYLQWLRCNY